MATQLQLRRGTTAENNAFTGGAGEVTVDTQTHALRVHDGSTLGGFQVDTVVFFQRPTVDNNYTWVRKYASGWVEQGGKIQINGPISSSNKRISFPVTMANTNYFAIAAADANVDFVVYVGWQAVDGMSIGTKSDASTNTTTWEVKGMAA